MVNENTEPSEEELEEFKKWHKNRYPNLMNEYMSDEDWLEEYKVLESFFSESKNEINITGHREW